MRDQRPWTDRAACRGASAEIFFSSDPVDLIEALRLCHQCPVRLACLEHALLTPETHGIWGGASAIQRRRLRRHAPLNAVVACGEGAA